MNCHCITSSVQFPLLRSQFPPNRRPQRQQNSPSPSPILHIFRQIHISPQRQRFASLKGNAIPPISPVLASSTIPPSQSGDASVLLLTGTVLLIAYFIANFVVPELIMKSYRSNESEENARADDRESGASEGENRARSLGRKKQGFSGNKR